MSLNNNDEISPQSSPLQDSLEVGTNDSMIATSLINDDTLRAKRRGRKPKYPDPTPGYRSSYSVNRSFTQTEVQLLKHILKDAGEPPADLFATRVWPPSPHPPHHHHQHTHHQEHHQAIMPNNDQCDVKIDSTMVFPVNEENPKNQELLLNARRKRSRNVTSPYQSRVLRKVLAVTSFPSTEMREALANALNMHPRTVQIWFQNQRQKAKNNPQAIGSNSINGMTQIDEYSPELLPINIQQAAVPSTIFFHNNLNIFPNNNVNVVQNAIGTQSAPPLPPSSATDDLRQTNDNVTQTHSMSTTDKDSGQLQVAQNFVPVATYINQFAAAPYAILPIFQPNGAAAQFHHANQQQQQQQHHHHHHHQPQSSPPSNQSYFHQSTLQFPVYQQPHPVTPQQQPHHQSNPSPQSSPNDPPLNILAAAALQAEGDPTQHHPAHHQAQSISGRYVHSAASVMNHPIVVSSPVVGDW